MRGALPGGALIAWVSCALVVLVAYRLAEREFERVEVFPGMGEDARLIG